MSIQRSTLCLVDSNVLVYMFDISNPARREIAIRVYDRLLAQRRLVLSTQCLTEFVNVSTRKLPPRLPIEQAVEMVDRLQHTAIIHPVTIEVAIGALQAISDFQMSLWDALIWAIASQHSVGVILTEDAQSNPVIEGVRYINPFASDFDLDSL